jgi:hypothetical protein
MDRMNICELLAYIIIFVTICLIVRKILRSPTTTNVIENFAMDDPPKFNWEKPLSELNVVNPLLWKSWFNPVYIKKFDASDNLKNGKIFVSVASYRDDQCSDTVKSLIDNADRPDLLRIVICQQNGLFDDDCLSSSDKKGAIVEIERLFNLQARGPTYARWKIQQRIGNEEYYLQLDSHSRLVKGWDTSLKNQLELCPSDHPVLTQYPSDYQIVEKSKRNDPIEEKWEVDKLRGGLYIQKFDENDNFTRIQSDYTTEFRRVPFKADGWGGCFSFSKSDFAKNVQYDPYTPFLFFGEEMDITIRGYTQGYDYYSPSINIVFTSFKRDHRNTFWENPIQKPLEILSRFRIYHRLGYVTRDQIPEKYHFILIENNKFPMGTKRTIEDYERSIKRKLARL